MLTGKKGASGSDGGWVISNPSSSSDRPAPGALQEVLRHSVHPAKTESRYNRFYPFHNMIDTVGKDRPESFDVFRDDEILEVSIAPYSPAKGMTPMEFSVLVRQQGFQKALRDTPIKSGEFSRALYDTLPRAHWYAKDCAGHHIFQQPAQRACVDSCAGMLLLDKGIDVADTIACTSSLSKPDSAIALWRQYGFHGETEDVPRGYSPPEIISFLNEKIISHGSLLLSLYFEQGGGHTIILDSFSDDRSSALIRDPYHGWIIRVKSEALTGRYLDDVTYIVGKIE
ncbi:hypothetical protein [Parendozoicomonas haliclonae]|uniref:Uncharacterized protein n=1 Tax=Parendozoicomonas haliclonae TaxID=1960125 RepID=A0A1X7AJ28_9GAMM|nr:hypothetical protein [Parendozoicomonas haliclonae]SMA45169.1 hypothetical protein EHSB41UT_01863 [Parendozoicomonas haliclonae]